MEKWQFNVLFFVGVGGAVFLLFAPVVGLNVDRNPTALTGVGLILTYVLTQKKEITKNGKHKEEPKRKEEDEGESRDN